MSSQKAFLDRCLKIKAPIQEKYFTIDAEIAFDLNEFLDFNKVPGLDEPAEDLAALQQEHASAAEPDLT